MNFVTFGRDITGISFEDFVPVAMQSRNHHWESLDRILPIVENQVRIDHLVPFSSLQENQELITEFFGMSASLPWKNQTTKKQETALSLETTNMIDEEYQLEMQLFFPSD